MSNLNMVIFLLKMQETQEAPSLKDNPAFTGSVALMALIASFMCFLKMYDHTEQEWDPGFICMGIIFLALAAYMGSLFIQAF